MKGRADGEAELNSKKSVRAEVGFAVGRSTVVR